MLHGSRIGRFKIQRHIGRGGAGDVYLATDSKTGGLVALKLIYLASSDLEMVEAEKKGTALQKRLGIDVPEIAQVYDWGEVNGYWYVSMEYVEGVDLSILLKDGRLPEQQAVSIALQLCRVLEKIELASQGATEGRPSSVIHGDIKPANIILQPPNRLRLLDFGVAKQLAYSREFTRQAFGSTPYLSPERLLRGVVDRQSDLWAVAVILYQMVTGNLPFPGDTLEEVECRILRGTPPAPIPDTNLPHLQSILSKALAIDVRQRYASITSLRLDLEALLEGRAINTKADQHRAQSVETMRTAIAASTSRVAKLPEPLPAPISNRPSARRNPQRALGLPVAALLLLGSAAFLRELWIWKEARDLRNQLSSSSPSIVETTAALSEYRRLQDGGFMDLGLSEVRALLAHRLTAEIDQLIDRSRLDVETLTEMDWLTARDKAIALLQLTEKRESTAAKLLLCQANVRRFKIDEYIRTGQFEDAHRLFNESIAELREAARLIPDWSAPYTSMISLYDLSPESAGWFPSTAITAALQSAESRGYVLSEQDAGKLAAIQLRQAQDLRWKANTLEDPEQAIRLLLQAEQLLVSSLQRPSIPRDDALLIEAELTLLRRTLEEWEDLT